LAINRLWGGFDVALGGFARISGFQLSGFIPVFLLSALSR
jgi:hypothetical protein